MALWVWGESLGSFEGLEFEEESREVRRRLEGEKVTVAEIFGGGVEEEDEKEGGEGLDGILGLEAKKRDITCCFCLPIVTGDGGGGSESKFSMELGGFVDLARFYLDSSNYRLSSSIPSFLLFTYPLFFPEKCCTAVPRPIHHYKITENKIINLFFLII